MPGDETVLNNGSSSADVMNTKKTKEIMA